MPGARLNGCALASLHPRIADEIRCMEKLINTYTYLEQSHKRFLTETMFFTSTFHLKQSSGRHFKPIALKSEKKIILSYL